MTSARYVVLFCAIFSCGCLGMRPETEATSRAREAVARVAQARIRAQESAAPCEISLATQRLDGDSFAAIETMVAAIEYWKTTAISIGIDIPDYDRAWIVRKLAEGTRAQQHWHKFQTAAQALDSSIDEYERLPADAPNRDLLAAMSTVDLSWTGYLKAASEVGQYSKQFADEQRAWKGEIAQLCRRIAMSEPSAAPVPHHVLGGVSFASQTAATAPATAPAPTPAHASSALPASPAPRPVWIRQPAVATTPARTATVSAPAPWPGIAENGDVRNRDNDGDGRREPNFVRGYTRKDGTYVRSYYRAAPRR